LASLKFGDLTIKLPKLDVVTVNQLHREAFGLLIIGAKNSDAILDVTVIANNEGIISDRGAHIGPPIVAAIGRRADDGFRIEAFGLSQRPTTRNR
jgi:hypothetical protein